MAALESRSEGAVSKANKCFNLCKEDLAEPTLSRRFKTWFQAFESELMRHLSSQWSHFSSPKATINVCRLTAKGRRFLPSLPSAMLELALTTPLPHLLPTPPSMS